MIEIIIAAIVGVFVGGMIGTTIMALLSFHKLTEYEEETKIAAQSRGIGGEGMREILFRGKRIDNGEWVCSGNIFHLNENGGEYYIPNINTKCTTTHECNSIGEYGNISAIVCKNDTRLYKVNPETVGQYTGLTDKNGRKIFEGDILKIHYTTELFGETLSTQYNALVMFEDGCNVAKSIFDGAELVNVLSAFSNDEVEAIGNIHDNPELLEVGK